MLRLPCGYDDRMDMKPHRVALDNCAQEPIHTPGQIQTFGTLFAADGALERVEYLAGNFSDLTGLGVNAVLGKSPGTFLTGELVQELRQLLALGTSRLQRERLGEREINGRPFDLYCHINNTGLAVVELEEVNRTDPSDLASADRVRGILANISSRDDELSMLNAAVEGLKQLTGYERVKAYVYAPNGDGEVVAEAREPHVESFLGLRYPAWDVPEQARALQVRHPLRLLTDTDYHPAPVLSARADAQPLDLSLAHLRGVSPVHIEYLRNMRVQATLSLGIVVGGKLWGLFAFHHSTPKTVPAETRLAVDIFGQMFSLVLQKMIEQRKSAARGRADAARRRIIEETGSETDLLAAFDGLAPVLSGVTDCDGIALMAGDEVATWGNTPTPEALRALVRHVAPSGNPISALGNLGALDIAPAEALGSTAGALLIGASGASDFRLGFFRDETVRKVTWAGNPEKTIVTGPNGPRLSPRGSFAAYMEERRGFADEWTPADLAAAEELQILLAQLLARAERNRSEAGGDAGDDGRSLGRQRQQDLLIAELNHRVKNILALIKSLSRQARQSSGSLESYALALEQRIAALAAAHDLAVANTDSGVALRQILETEFRPYVTPGSGQLLLDGPPVGLRADVAPMLTLVLHELVTNAAKYGALSVEDGLVRVIWSVDSEGLKLGWSELNGPEVTPPTRSGFGRSLVERAIPYEFDGRADLDFSPRGLRFNCALDGRYLSRLDEEPAAAPPPPERGRDTGRVAAGRTALLVEDNVVLTMDMVESLTLLGCDRIETASSVDTALGFLDAERFDFAVLDMNLRGTVSFDVAKRLRDEGVPFVFVTGYGSHAQIPGDLADVRILTKPIDQGSLSRELGRLLS